MRSADIANVLRLISYYLIFIKGLFFLNVNCAIHRLASNSQQACWGLHLTLMSNCCERCCQCTSVGSTHTSSGGLGNESRKGRGKLSSPAPCHHLSCQRWLQVTVARIAYVFTSLIRLVWDTDLWIESSDLENKPAWPWLPVADFLGICPWAGDLLCL